MLDDFLTTIAPSPYVEVAVYEPVHQLYTYRLPAELDQLTPGSIVEVPFGRRRAKACIIRRLDTLPTALENVRIKAVIREVTPGFALTPDILELALWISSYYMAPPGDCCACVSYVGLNDIAAQTVKRFLITREGSEALTENSGARLGKMQRAALAYLAEQRGELVTATDIHNATSASLATIKSLVGRGWAEELIHTVNRPDSYAQMPGGEQELKLSEEQREVFDRISTNMDAGKPATYLLHGVTGSGKTEIYLQAIRKALESGGQAIVLVPEISLTPQTVERFRSRFGNIVGVYHSRLTLGQKFDLWRDVICGRIKIMVGARSALFTPFPKIKVIVVDEEHEMTYKQDSSPRYHARDIAIKRAHDCGAVCVLGSATPAIESYYKAQSGKFELLTLKERIDAKPLPPVTVVDMAEEVREEGNPEFLGRALFAAMGEALGRKEQVLLFLNRRGFFNFLICLQCHEAAKCLHCDVALTHHKLMNKLMCHYCGREYVVPKQCSHCESTELGMIGLGTERLEEIVQQTFSSARVMRLDLDTTRKREAWMDAWKTLQKGDVDIILGTQMIAKGLHLENVTVVGLPMADGAFYQPDFRATERGFALMTQVAGRAGRGSKPGRVFLQTYVPDHYAVIYAQAHDYIGFYKKEIRVREVLRFPPHYRLIAVLGIGKKEEETADLIKEYTRLLKKHAHKFDNQVQVLGPSPAPLSKINDNYRWRVLLRSKTQSQLREVLSRAAEDFQDVKGKSTVQIIVDVDPMDLL
jgi:primosomal protein N' (replication factor Y)